MSFRLLSVAILLCLGVPALAKPPEVPLDPTITCSCCALAAEVPVDDLLLASLAEQRHSWDYRDLVLDTLVPVMRLRHLSPEHVKAAVDELRPEFDEAVEKWHDFVAQCTARPIQAPPARCEEAETEECEPADDVWEAQVELKNRRSGDVVRLPNVTIINGESDVQVLVDGQVLRLKLTIVEPVSVMPHEMEEVTVAPHEVGDCEEAEVEGAEPAFQVGEIIIVGNSVTPEEAVRRALPFEPGAFVTYSAVRQAETDLAILDYLVMPDSNCSVRASVTVLDEDAESAVKDILVTIEETPLVDPRVYQLIQFPSKCTPNKNSSEGEPQEAATDDSGVQSPPAVCPKPTPVESVCPYMRQKSQQHAEEPEVVLPASVEENLEKLLQARKALRKAEKCRDKGDLDAACEWYEQVKTLCPGSRLDTMATSELEAIQAKKAAEQTGSSETQDPEAAPPSDSEEQSSDVPETDGFFTHRFGHKCCVPEMCRARLLVLFEAYCACAWHCDGCTLLWKAHACLPRPSEPTIYPGCHTDATEESDGDQPQGDAARATQPYDVPLHPCLPEVDPKIVDALEKVLQQSGEPEKPKLIVVPVEPAATEPPDEPVALWPLAPIEQEMPSLYIIDADEDDLEAEEAAPVEAEKPDVGELLREVLGALQGGVYVDVSNVDPESLERKVNVRVGSIECSMMTDNFGNRYFLVGLLPEATRNVKLMAQSLNERVLRWIELSNSGGNTVEEAEDGTDEPEDLTDDDEPDWESN